MTRTTLEAVAEIVERIGEPHPSLLDTGGTSDVAEAEAILDRVRKQVLHRKGPGILGGWSFNTDRKATLLKPSVALAAFAQSTANDIFTIGETVTGGTSGATS